MENWTSPNTLPVGVSLISRTPGIVVSKAFLAFPASDCNGWVRLWGLAQGCEWQGVGGVRLETSPKKQNSMDSGMDFNIAPASVFAQPTLREKPTAFGGVSQTAVRR